MVEAFHDKTIVVQMTTKPKNVHPNLTGNKNEVQLNVEAILVTQPVLASTIMVRQMDEVVQPNLIGMFVEYGAPRFIQEGQVNPAQTSDARDNFIFAFDSY